jgi:hypothetical protein
MKTQTPYVTKTTWNFLFGYVYHLGFYLLCVIYVMTMIVVGVDVLMYDDPNGMSFVQFSFRRRGPCVCKF